jgi:hypothetical protein
MVKSILRYFLLSIFLVFITIQNNFAGPPFLTDDPEPVEYQHWEYYISSINTWQPSLWIGTSPHMEVNYGIIHNVQVHMILPMNYEYSVNQRTSFGYGYTEFGLKYRFVQESNNTPQIGTFPIIEIPTIPNKDFNNGKAQIYFPLWVQKSWGKLTTYGGTGYWINPGTGNKNWIFSGWELQYDLTPRFTLGGELYYHSRESTDINSALAFNVGGFINFTEKFHVIFSAGLGIANSNFTTTYFGFLWTI